MFFKKKFLKYAHKNFIVFNSSILTPIKLFIKKSKIIKITLNRGLGNFTQNNKITQMSIEEFRLITGQHPLLTYSKKSIAGFKLREKSLIGLKVTLRKERMYSFLDRFIHLALPQIMELKGFSIKHFDTHGNYNFGIKDQSIFTEIDYDKITHKLGFNITIGFLTKDLKNNFILLKNFGFPFE